MSGEVDEDVMDLHIKPLETYDFYTSLEAAVCEAENENDFSYDRGTIGFTAPQEIMQKIDPRQVAIIQCAARKGTEAEHIVSEKEIRFWPNDLKIVRYYQP